jgi:NADPH2:quinone reductase
MAVKAREGTAQTGLRVRRAADTIPNEMRAAAIDRFGGPEVLTLHVLPVPALDASEVLIAIDTAGVGSWDADMRAGWSPSGRAHFPLVLGTDGAGTVAAVGRRVRRFRPGDLVYSYSFDNPKGGFYAEYVAVAADKVGRVPEGLDPMHAGAIPTTGLTALQGVDDALHLRKGEAVTIHGASGGVGTLAVQFAKLRGARVFATASGKDGVALVLRLGADAAVDGKCEDVAVEARRFAPGGVDAVLALAGKTTLERCLSAVRPGGQVAYPNGVEPEPQRREGLQFISYDAVSGAAEFERLGRAVKASELEVPIAACYRLSDAVRAHERLAAGHVLGKIVLRVREETQQCR